MSKNSVGPSAINHILCLPLFVLLPLGKQYALHLPEFQPLGRQQAPLEGGWPVHLFIRLASQGQFLLIIQGPLVNHWAVARIPKDC